MGNIFVSKYKGAILIFSLLLVFTTLIWGWPLHYTLPISGRILDKTTHQPIPNAIVECMWVKKSALGIIEAVSQEIGVGYFASNSKGEYRIPGKYSLHVFSWYSYMHATVRHPIYETFGMMVDEVGVIRGRARDDQKVTKDMFVYDIELMKLEEKYKASSRAMDGEFLSVEVDDNAPKYCKAAKKLRLGVDCQKFFPAWDKIGSQYGIKFRLAKETILN